MKPTTWLLLGLLPLAACNDRKLSLCDITDSECQEDIYYTDLRVRGDGYDPFGGMPPIRTISEADYRKELEDAAAATPSTDPYPWWDAALKLLHFVPETDLTSTSIDDRVTNVAAYYSSDTKSVTVVSHPGDSSTDNDPKTQLNRQINNMTTLAHELIHALQDRELDFRRSATSTDSDFAETALIEGDASLYEELVRYEIQLPNGYKWTSTDPAAYFAKWRTAYLGDDFSDLGAPFFAAHWLVYPLGGAWLADQWKDGGNAAVRRGYANAPKRSLDYILGPGAALPAETPIKCYPSKPDLAFTNADGRPYGLDTFGAMQFYAFLSAWSVDADDRLAAATQWRNDYIFVYYNPTTKKTAVAWHIELASPLPASVLAAITTTDGPRVVADGNSLMITASDDAELMTTWNPSARCPASP
jgi:hypothetical protein